ncbi:tubulin polyglutamylase complex subunit 2, partial [Trichonephila clavata]
MDRSPFIENLTLGIAKYFEKLPCIKSTVISEKTHVQETALVAWEQKNSSRLSHLKSIGPKRQSINSELPSLLDIESDSEDVYDGHLKPKFKDGCKIFVLDHCQGAGKVCLVYPKRK